MTDPSPVADWIERTRFFERQRRDASTGIPADILRNAAQRLAWMALVVTAVLIVNLLIVVIAPVFEGADQQTLLPLEIVIGIAILVSGAVYFVARFAPIPSRHKLTMGLVFEVALAFWFGVVISSMAPTYLYPRAGVSEVCLIILAFPFLVPSSPGRTFVAALLAASMDPLGYFYVQWQGREVPPLGQMFGAYYWNYLCAAVAVIPAFVFHRLSREVGKARTMGAYQLVEQLGAGGMGEVWRARHAQLPREAAVKIIRPEKLQGNVEDAAKAIARFEREARATAALESPHSVQIYDFGITEDGTFYYVMEMLNGFDLKNLVLQHGPQPEARVAAILQQACESLGDAHDRGLLHRDVKPANLFVCRRARDADFVKVLDFGLVSLSREIVQEDSWDSGGGRAPSASQDVQLTREGKVVGTPAFLAPEMVRKDQPIDGRSDLYSLGCLAYWLLAGANVFAATTPKEMLQAHREEEPEPPSQVRGEPIDPRLEAIVLRCLAKRVEDRPKNAWELRDALAETGLADAWREHGARDWWQSAQIQSA